MSLGEIELYRKIYGCWLGKAIGGTLGTPHEGKTGPLELTFYDPVPKACLPNDDLDLQLVWLHHLRSIGALSVTPEILAAAWDRYVLFPFDEYGVARRNFSLGLQGSRQGARDNFFGECMGAAIRSEIWACLAPNDPNRAAGFAWADAVVDHCGDGVWAEIFHAGMQSAAFSTRERDRIIRAGLDLLPRASRL
jgi:ADP-ribosylglycohydrolase